MDHQSRLASSLRTHWTLGLGGAAHAAGVNHRLRRAARIAFASLIVSGLSFVQVEAQQNKPGQGQPGQGAKPPATSPKAPAKGNGPATAKLSDKEKKTERARELFADAANAQNNGAFDLAIELWNKMLKESGDDPLAPSAHHYLGRCYLQKDAPDYEAAIREFRIALQDEKLKEREEALLNLGESLFQTAVSEADPSKSPKLVEASKVLASVIDKYQDGSFLDRALFYAAESESRLGNPDKAISFYKQIIQSKKLENSTVRPDAIFGIGLAYEDKKQLQLALENYELFLSKYSVHPFANDVRLRSAEIALSSNDSNRAIAFLEPIRKSKEFANYPNADYVLYRLGFAYAKAGKFDDSAAAYKTLAEQFPKSQYSKNSSLAAGQALMREKKYDEAVKAFELLLPIKDERAAEAAHWICQIKTMQGKPADAVSIANSALQWASKMPSAVALRMDLADGMSADPNQREAAKKLYEQIALENPDDPIAPRATYNAAFSALQLGALADAQRWSEAFAKRFPNDPLTADVAYVRAESTLQLGQYESAITGFEQLIAAQPEDALRGTWELRLAAARFLLGQYDATIETTDRLLKTPLEPNARAETLYMRGASLLKTSKLPESINSLQKSLEASDQWQQADEVTLTLAEAFTKAGKSNDAKQALERLLQKYPQSRLRPQAEFRIGQISASNNDFDRAIQAYDSVLATAKDKSLLEYASYGKAFILIQREKFQEALALLEPLSAPERNDSVAVEAKIAKAICLRQTKNPSQAAQVLESLAKSSVASDSAVKILYELGLSYAANEQFREAIEQFTKLVKQGDKFPMLDKAIYELAWAHKSLGENQQAIDAFQMLIDKHPESKLSGEAYFHVGQAEYDSSKYDRAIKAYTVAASKSLSDEIQEKSLYKLGWSFFQQRDFDSAARQFKKQFSDFPKGPLSLDAQFMVAECLLKQEKFEEAFGQYNSVRDKMATTKASVTDQVQTLLYLHGAQSARELKKWKETESWISQLLSKFPESSYVPIAKYELAYAKQNQKKTNEAVSLYSEVAEEYRNEIGARSRFMMGEVFFAERDFAKAVSEFQKVMYGYGGTQAPDEIKNWQARSAFEAGRCSEVLIADLTGDRRQKAIDVAVKFYEFVLNNHGEHPLAKQAKDRISDLKGKG